MKKKILFFMLALLPALTMSAKKKEFYNSKSMIVGITTNNTTFYSAGLGSKIFDNRIPRFDFALRLNGDKFDPEGTVRQMNNMGVGKKILDLLVERDKGALSLNLLKQRAWQNIQLADVERAAHGKYDPNTILTDDILPILESNYILLIHEYGQKTKMLGGQKSKVAWIVLHVDIDLAKWGEVSNAWENLSQYDKINVNVSYVASGVAKEKENLYTYNDHNYSGLIRDIARKAPALAVRGQILNRSTYSANIGTKNGVKPGWDLVRVFRQSIDKDGKMVSSEIGKARAGVPVGDSIIELRTVAGKTGSYKNGDQAVLMPVGRTGRSLMFQWKEKMQALRYDFDININMSNAAVLHVHEIDLRVGMLGKKDLPYKDNIGTPFFGSIGTGIGVGALFLKGCELEAYGMLQLEGWTCSAKDGFEFVTSDDGKKSKESIYGGYVNLPLGVRLQVNIAYPLRIVGGVEYGIKLVGFNKDIERCIIDPQDWKRHDLNFFVGLRYAY